MREDLPVYIGENADAKLLDYCRAKGFDKFVLVADENTYRAYGRRVHAALTGQGWDVIPAVVSGQEVIADEHYLIQVLLKADRQDRIYLAVGSGTLTDVSRFVSFKTKTSFISVPTAPSVDGFTSTGAPLVIEGVKVTVFCHGPLAVFADLDVLVGAPPRLIAAGFGDMIGKLMSVADWRLGHVLWGEPYDAAIEQRSRRAAAVVAEQAAAIGQGSRDGIRALMEGLIESGFCMLDFGTSAPASGAEHHMSHFLELKLLREGRPAIFHGTKVGISSIMTARLFHRVAALSRDDVKQRLAASSLPDRQALEGQIREVYGPIAEDVLAAQAAFLNMSEERFAELKQHILDRWQDVQDIAAVTPPPEQFAQWLAAAGGPTEPQSIGFSAQDADTALRFGPYLRNRFTIVRLAQYLGML